MTPGEWAVLATMIRASPGLRSKGKAVAGWSAAGSAPISRENDVNINRLAPLAVLLAFSLSCDGGTTEPDSASVVDRIVITPATFDLDVGETTQLVATPQTAQGVAVSGLTVTWTSSNETVATVSAFGVVSGVGIGSVTITAAASGKTGSVSGAVATSIIITQAGGTVMSADGHVRLVVPAGAVTAPVRISIVPSTGLPAHPRLVPGSAYRFSPSGLQFQVPVEVNLNYGAVPAAMANSAAYIWLHKWVNDDWVPIPGLAPDTLTKTARGQLTSFSDYGAALSNLASNLQQLNLSLNRVLSDPIARDALDFLSALAALLAQQPDPLFQALVTPVLGAMSATACGAYRNAITVARNTTVNTYEQMNALLEPVYSWAAIVEKLAPGTCDPPISFFELHTQKFEQFVNFYTARLTQPDFTTDFVRLIDEGKFVMRLRQDAELLGLDQAGERLLEDGVKPLLQKLRESAYTACRNNAVHQHLGALRVEMLFFGGEVPFTEDDVLSDLQYCATQLDWKLIEAGGTPADQGSMGGGQTPGSIVREDGASGLATGQLELSHDVRAFRCANGTVAPDELLVSFSGVEVKRLQPGANGNFFGSPLTLQMSQIVEAAGIDPAAVGVHALEIQRTTAGCTVNYVTSFDVPFTLATLNLSYPVTWSYRNDFSTTAGPGWSAQQITTAPGGQRFLGVFGNAVAALDQANLPAHTELVIELDVYILATMDGNSTQFGPDVIEFELDGAILKKTTFSNDNESKTNLRQAFPGDYPGGDFPAGTGATGINVLGYPPDDPEDAFDDSTYRLTFTVPHSATSFRFVVRGTGQEGYPNEGWGIDNVRIIAR